LGSRVDPNKLIDGNNALHTTIQELSTMASTQCNVLTELLLDAGTDPNHVNSKGQTCLDCAVSIEQNEVGVKGTIELLQQRGARSCAALVGDPDRDPNCRLRTALSDGFACNSTPSWRLRAAKALQDHRKRILRKENSSKSLTLGQLDRSGTGTTPSDVCCSSTTLSDVSCDSCSTSHCFSDAELRSLRKAVEILKEFPDSPCFIMVKQVEDRSSVQADTIQEFLEAAGCPNPFRYKPGIPSQVERLRLWLKWPGIQTRTSNS